MSFKSILLAFLVSISIVSSSPVEKRAFLRLFPNLIINLNSNNPSAASATSYTANITPSTPTLFSFDIPYSINPTCTLHFELPPPMAYFPYIANAKLSVIPLHGVVGTPTSYSAVTPLLGTPFGAFDVFSAGVAPFEGSATVPCNAGTRFQVVFVSFEFKLILVVEC
jgi:Ubiquitin 3 binding protein But2 C-terminal domain